MELIISRDYRNSPLNIWNKKEFYMDVHFEKNILIGTVKHLKNRIKWSIQRIVRGYADCDRWSIDSYLQMLIPDMLQNLRDNRQGSPCCLADNYVNNEGRVVNDTCHAEWDKILDKMIFLWRESREETCSRNSPDEEEYRQQCQMEALDMLKEYFYLLWD